MTWIVFSLLAVFLSLFIVMPILQSRTRLAGWWGKGDSNHHASDLQERKENIYAAIKDIEFDYQMGKLSEEDFKELRQQYKDEAVNLLKEIDATQQKIIKPAAPQSKSKSKEPVKGKAAKFCWICGTPVTKADKFCANCGTRISESA